MQLHHYIASLLKEHNCVIVPDFGGFVANYRSAVVDEFRKKIHPPAKSVLFNPHLINNDGLLGNYVSKQRAVDYLGALSYISEEVKAWSSKIESGERIEIGEIGFLYSKAGKVQFEQSREVNLLLAAYGLKTIDFVDFSTKGEVAAIAPIVKADPRIIKEIIVPITEKVVETKVEEEIEQKPIEKEIFVEQEVLEIASSTKVIALNTSEKIEEVAVEHEQETDIIPIKRNRLGVVVKYAAAVCIVPMLFYSYWIPMETDALDTGSIQVADFNPIHKQIERTYDARISVFEPYQTEEHQNWEDLTAGINSDIYNLEFSEDFYIPVQLLRDEVIEEVDKTNVDLNPIETIIESNEVISTGDYHVISGCFSVKKNAENLVADLKSQGFNAQIVDKQGGLHRVSAGGFNSRQDAKSGLESVRSNGFSAWILSK
ncbi:MAG: hypothetical protein ACI857_000801 [Arenicella sp.]|jgi:uncharacterized protein YegP (UPF0339 family)